MDFDHFKLQVFYHEKCFHQNCLAFCSFQNHKTLTDGKTSKVNL